MCTFEVIKKVHGFYRMVLQKQLFKLKLKMFARKTTAHVYASLKIDSRSSGTRTYYW